MAGDLRSHASYCSIWDVRIFPHENRLEPGFHTTSVNIRFADVYIELETLRVIVAKFKGTKIRPPYNGEATRKETVPADQWPQSSRNLGSDES